MSESEDGRSYGLGQVAGEWPAYEPPDEQDLGLARWFAAKFGPGWVPNPNCSGALLGVPSGGEEPSASAPLSSEWRDAGCVDETPGGRCGGRSRRWRHSRPGSRTGACAISIRVGVTCCSCADREDWRNRCLM